MRKRQTAVLTEKIYWKEMFLQVKFPDWLLVSSDKCLGSPTALGANVGVLQKQLAQKKLKEVLCWLREEEKMTNTK